jgi:hypothetical protein
VNSLTFNISIFTENHCLVLLFCPFNLNRISTLERPIIYFALFLDCCLFVCLTLHCLYGKVAAVSIRVVLIDEIGISVRCFD